MELIFNELPSAQEEAYPLILAQLAKYCIQTEQWDVDDTKILQEFLKEVYEGELILYAVGGFAVASSRLVAVSDRVFIKATGVNPMTGRQSKAVDARHRYLHNGRIRERWMDGMREKKHLGQGESTESALGRAIYEESGQVLRIEYESGRFIPTGMRVDEHPKPSKAYPGLFEQRTVRSYALALTPAEMALSVPLPEDLFAPGTIGFVETQEFKIGYTAWCEQN